MKRRLMLALFPLLCCSSVSNVRAEEWLFENLVTEEALFAHYVWECQRDLNTVLNCSERCYDACVDLIGSSSDANARLGFLLHPAHLEGITALKAVIQEHNALRACDIEANVRSAAGFIAAVQDLEQLRHGLRPSANGIRSAMVEAYVRNLRLEREELCDDISHSVVMHDLFPPPRGMSTAQFIRGYTINEENDRARISVVDGFIEEYDFWREVADSEHQPKKLSEDGVTAVLAHISDIESDIAEMRWQLSFGGVEWIKSKMRYLRRCGEEIELIRALDTINAQLSIVDGYLAKDGGVKNWRKALPEMETVLAEIEHRHNQRKERLASLKHRLEQFACSRVNISSHCRYLTLTEISDDMRAFTSEVIRELEATAASLPPELLEGSLTIEFIPS